MRSMFSQKTRSPDLPYRQGVGVVLLDGQGMVCICKTKGNGIWKMPQGGIEKGESSEEAAFRELKEEVGITNAVLLKKTRTNYAYDYPEGDQYIPGFRGQSFKWYLMKVEGTPVTNTESFSPEDEGAEFSEVRWVSPQEAVELAHDDKNGDSVTWQRQQMFKGVFREFNLIKDQIENSFDMK